jgi:hypothetical protein
MKKKFVIINSLLSVVVLFSIVFQSVHSFQHLAKQLTEKKCFHEHKHDFEITHQHQEFEHCFVCDFTLNSFINTELQFISFQKKGIATQVPFSNSKAITSFFKGSLFSLRAPPRFIV